MGSHARDRRICLGIVLGPHGVRGALKIRSFTDDPQAIAAYGPLEDEAGRLRLRLTPRSASRDVVIADAEGIKDRDAAQALAGTRLYVERDALPEPEEDEYYHADLIGLRAEAVGGKLIGRIKAVLNYGAGDILEIEPEAGGETLLVPFRSPWVPRVELAEGRVVVFDITNDY